MGMGVVPLFLCPESFVDMLVVPKLGSPVRHATEIVKGASPYVAGSQTLLLAVVSVWVYIYSPVPCNSPVAIQLLHRVVCNLKYLCSCADPICSDERAIRGQICQRRLCPHSVTRRGHSSQERREDVCKPVVDSDLKFANLNGVNVVRISSGCCTTAARVDGD